MAQLCALGSHSEPSDVMAVGQYRISVCSLCKSLHVFGDSLLLCTQSAGVLMTWWSVVFSEKPAGITQERLVFDVSVCSVKDRAYTL